jgi:hypothetical protein
MAMNDAEAARECAKVADEVISPCDDPEVNPYWLAEVYDFWVGDERSFACTFRGRSYQMVPIED